LMRKYGNMFRAADCPNMAVINRARTTDIRLLCGNTAVHSDMYMWHRDDPVEKAALQILNVLFSVPQLSVRLDSVPEEHIRMIKFWTEYW
ncbi:MAG: alpha-galactosidase, partial [Deltaproteobacteria bacterium]|nr:alpha-galactosidase [Deltaproteobacteria bacterium]